MLVISRQSKQKLTIGTEIEVEVVRIERNRVILGVTAPREIPVVRDDAKKGPKAA